MDEEEAPVPIVALTMVLGTIVMMIVFFFFVAKKSKEEREKEIEETSGKTWWWWWGNVSVKFSLVAVLWVYVAWHFFFH